MRAREDLGWVADVLLGAQGRDAVVTSSIPSGYDPVFTLGALPSAANPYALFPPEPILASASLRELGNPVLRKLRVAEDLLAMGLRSGMPQRIFTERIYISVPRNGGPPHLTLVDHFRELFGRSDLSLAVILGKKRPNRKPVLKILTSQGECIGFAKVGWNEVSRALVGNEARILQSMAARETPLGSFQVPEVLEHVEIDGADFLVLKPVPRSRALGGGGSLRLPIEAAREIAAMTGQRTEVLSSSPYWEDLKARIAAATKEGVPRIGALSDGVDALETRFGTRDITFGAWHGDFIPWNMKRSGGAFFVWDWERSGGMVPLGLDAARFDLDVRVKIRRERPRDAVQGSVTSLGPALEAMGAAPGTATLVTTLHALEMVLRFQEARVAGVAGKEPIYEVALDEMLRRIHSSPVR
jgi:hypothetical protein